MTLIGVVLTEAETEIVPTEIEREIVLTEIETEIVLIEIEVEIETIQKEGDPEIVTVMTEIGSETGMWTETGDTTTSGVGVRAVETTIAGLLGMQKERVAAGIVDQIHMVVEAEVEAGVEAEAGVCRYHLTITIQILL